MPSNSNIPNKIVVHPLVLLSVTDHYTRVAKDTNKRTVGILLGESSKGRIDITNSYAVPFEEDASNANIWYLDHDYHENMFAMFKKVNAKEKVVGWYSTGPKIRPADIDINEMIRRYTPNPVLVIIDVNPKNEFEIPTDAYCAVEQPPTSGEGSQQRYTFVHLPSEVGAVEAEEVGVEHLLRDIRDVTTTTLTDRISAKLTSLKGLKRRLEDIDQYLDKVLAGEMPPNPAIVYNLQNMFNLRPDLHVADVVRAFNVVNNDNMMVIYISSLIRSIVALHNLINNKLLNTTLEEDKDKKAEKEKEKEKEKKTK